MYNQGIIQPHYTLQFINGQVLRHQGPLELAQYRSDARLAYVWLEFPDSTKPYQQKTCQSLI